MDFVFLISPKALNDGRVVTEYSLQFIGLSETEYVFEFAFKVIEDELPLGGLASSLGVTAGEKT
jgi:hypothetical protein